MFDKLFSFLFESNHKFSNKFITTFFIVISFLACDYFFRFSDTYIVEKKIEQLGKINSLIKEDSLSVDLRRELINMEKDVINRKDFWESISDVIYFIEQTINTPSRNATTITTHQEHRSERNIIWHVVTSNWIFILVMILTPFIYYDTKAFPSLSIFVGILLYEFTTLVFIALCSYLLALIPVFKYPIFNYLLNIIALPCLIGFAKGGAFLIKELRTAIKK